MFSIYDTITKDAPETAIDIDSEDCIKLGVPPKVQQAPTKSHELMAAAQTKDYHYVYSIFDCIGQGLVRLVKLYYYNPDDNKYYKCYPCSGGPYSRILEDRNLNIDSSVDPGSDVNIENEIGKSIELRMSRTLVKGKRNEEEV